MLGTFTTIQVGGFNMNKVNISNEIFHWAIQRAGMTRESLAVSMHTKIANVIAWEEGRDFPSFQQALKMASLLGIPLGYLFLSNIPTITNPIADFRTIPGQDSTTLSLNLQEILDDTLRKRDWYREWRQTESLPKLGFVGRYSVSRNIPEIIVDLRRELGIPENFTSRMTSWDEHLRSFVFHIESIGILVMQSGIVGNNTHKKLSLEEFRGFTIADEYAPIIFINAQDSIAARVFTLAHELAHIWTGTSGISNPEISTDTTNQIQLEQFCNKIAAEFLVPENLVEEQWNIRIGEVENIQNLARYFRVSTQVILLRSIDRGYVKISDYYTLYNELLKTIPVKTRKSGGDFYNSLVSRNSKRFTRSLLSALSGGQLSYLDAARLLNTQPSVVTKVIENQSKGRVWNSV